MEPTAKKEFENKTKKRHSEFAVNECGIFLHKDNQFLGASPDLLVTCKCCGEGVVEIKCPLIPPCDICCPHLCRCPGKSLSYLVTDPNDSSVSLKVNHSYHAQIQGQMAITGYKYAYFFVYTSYAIHQERIEFDEKFWLSILNNLNFFHQEYLLPHLLLSTKDGDQSSTSKPEDMDVDDVNIESNVYFCPICHERVKEQENIISFGERSICCDSCDIWCHFKCVKMTKNSLKSLKTWKWFSCLKSTV